MLVDRPVAGLFYMLDVLCYQFHMLKSSAYSLGTRLISIPIYEQCRSEPSLLCRKASFTYYPYCCGGHKLDIGSLALTLYYVLGAKYEESSCLMEALIVISAAKSSQP
jgi:hypothetical protein